MTDLLNELKKMQSSSTNIDGADIRQFLYGLSEQQELIIERALMNQLPVAILMIDITGKLCFVNEMSEVLFERDTLAVGSDIADCLPEIELLDVLRNHKEQKAESFKLNSGKRIAAIRCQLLSDDGRLIGAIAICQPLADMIRFVEKHIEIHDLNKVFEGIVGSSEIAYYITDETGVCRYVNEAYVKLTGVSRELLMNKKNIEHDMHQQVLQKRRAQMQNRVVVGRFKKSVIVNVTPLMINGKLKGTIGVYHYAEQFEDLSNELERSKRLIRNLEKTNTFSDIIANSESMKLALEQAKVAANTSVPVLIRGEVGTGKKLLAHVIHNESARNFNKLIRVSCATIKEDQINELLFGTGKAMTYSELSYIEKARNGTLIIEDIDYLPIKTQEKLVQFMQKEGLNEQGQQPIRLIALASNNLEQAIMNQTFSEKLYYYLSRMPIYLPNLKERQEDLQQLVQHIIDDLNEKLSMHILQIAPNVYEMLSKKSWKGNLIELRNKLESLMIYAPKETNLLSLEANQEPIEEKQECTTNCEGFSLQETLEAYEKKIISQVYKANDFNKTKTAQALDVSVRNLYYKLDKFGIE